MAIRRIFLVVLDGVGIGELPDAARFGDNGSHSLGNTALAVGGLQMPFLNGLGLGRVDSILGLTPAFHPKGAYGKMAEASSGKDTITGHWEMMGVISESPFPTFPHGFPKAFIDRYEKAIGRKVIGNKVASGTMILDELGVDHINSGFPIVYTSADSVFQLAAHVDVVPLDELYRYCRIAREMLQDELGVARVIARPFAGKPGQFWRTPDRKDFAVDPPISTVMDRISAAGQRVYGVGKIEDIFNHKGLTDSNHTHNNNETLAALLEIVKTSFNGLVFANCIDFDMVYGHRNDVKGYAEALMEADRKIAELARVLADDELLMVTGDHGCDPTTASTDHSREYVPLLVYGPSIKPGVDLGVRTSFCDLGATVEELLLGKHESVGISFAGRLL